MMRLAERVALADWLRRAAPDWTWRVGERGDDAVVGHRGPYVVSIIDGTVTAATRGNRSWLFYRRMWTRRGARQVLLRAIERIDIRRGESGGG